ncbi:XRE family transcriptional regulator [Pseudonocardia endophytica]|uniref:XRE family transcriptional regulator n=1 Tax=Pseudonocardia endophytica TaxID=401976 RepID=UPI00104ED9CB|nr:XRE family transcriptional regulator [Pseudonocardia endophytica]
MLAETGKAFALDERAIGRWERGAVARPSAHYRAALRAVLAVDTDADLGFGDPPDQPVRLPVPAAEGEPPTVDAIRAMATSIHVADRQLGGGRLYKSVLDYLRNDVARALFTPMSGATVYAAAASLTEIAGWMAHDSGRDVDARAHFDGAYRLSLAAGSPALAANMCASMSHLATQLGQHEDALRIADEGLERAASVGGVARITGRLHAMRAAALGHRAEHRECRAELAAAERSLGGSNDHEHAAWAAHFDEGSFAGEAARALHQLADFDTAESYARRVLALRDGDRIRAQALGRLTLANILHSVGNHDEAADLGRSVARMAPTLHSARVRAQLGELALTISTRAPAPAATAFLAEVAALGRPDTSQAADRWPV